MELAYLLTMHCEEDGYWDTSGHCHWHRPYFCQNKQFDLNNTDDLIQTLGRFIESYPGGQYKIYLIQCYEWWNEDEFQYERDEVYSQKINSIEQQAIKLSKKINEDKKVKKIELDKAKAAQAKAEEKKRELELLEKLKEKYEPR